MSELTCSGCGEYAGTHISDRIEELEAENADLKAKLAKAVQVLKYYAQDDDDGGWLAKATLAELTGGKDE